MRINLWSVPSPTVDTVDVSIVEGYDPIDMVFEAFELIKAERAFSGKERERSEI